MTRKQKRESPALKAEVERLATEIARRDGVINTLPGTDGTNVAEEGISPTSSLAKGVDPDTDQSETGPPTDTGIAERERSLQQHHCQKGSTQILF
jgi:hypothetical protein